MYHHNRQLTAAELKPAADYLAGLLEEPQVVLDEVDPQVTVTGKLPQI
jgi:hypothetical protein